MLKSTSTGRSYDLCIRIPPDYEQNKAAKYPVLYILDGQWDFKLMDSVLGGLVYIQQRVDGSLAFRAS